MNELKLKKLLFASIAVGLLVVFGIMILLGKDQVIAAVLGTDLRLLSIAMAFELMSVVALTYRWQVVVHEGGFKVSDWKLFQISLSSITFSNLTPSVKTGGELAKCYFLNKETGGSTKDTLATVIAERIFDMAFFVMITIFTATLALLLFSIPPWIIALMILVAIFGITGIFIIFYTVTSESIGLRMSIWVIEKFKVIVKRFRPLKQFESKFKEDFEEHKENLEKYVTKPTLWMKSISMSGVMWVFDILRAYFIFLALGLQVHPILIISLIILSQVVGMAPFLPGGLGAVEASRIAVLSTAGVALAAAGAHTVLDRLLEFWILTALGLITTYYLGIKNLKKDTSINKVHEEISEKGGK